MHLEITKNQIYTGFVGTNRSDTVKSSPERSLSAMTNDAIEKRFLTILS